LHVFWSYINTNNYIDRDYTDDYGSTWNGVSSKDLGDRSGAINPKVFGLDTDPSNGDVYFYICWTVASYTQDRQYIFDKTNSFISSNKSRTYGGSLGGGLAIDSSGNIYELDYYKFYDLSLFKNGSNYEIYNTGSDDLKRGMFDIGIDGQDNVYCFYVKESDGKTYYKKFDGSSFGSETEVATGVRIGCEQHALGSSVILNTVYFNT
jgi:hypothetical protein